MVMTSSPWLVDGNTTAVPAIQRSITSRPSATNRTLVHKTPHDRQPLSTSSAHAENDATHVPNVRDSDVLPVAGDEDDGDEGVSLLSTRCKKRSTDGVAALLATVFMSISAVYTAYLIWSSNPRSLSWFAYHPPLQMLSLGLFTCGVLTLQPTNQPRAKVAGLRRHQLIMGLLGLPTIAAGTYAIYYNKKIGGRIHFVTWHGTIGIIAVAWTFAQAFIGGAMLGGGPRSHYIWKYHRLSGYLLYSLLLFAAHLGGAWSTFSTSHASHLMRLLAYSIGPIVTIASLIVRIRPSKMKFF